MASTVFGSLMPVLGAGAGLYVVSNTLLSGRYEVNCASGPAPQQKIHAMNHNTQSNGAMSGQALLTMRDSWGKFVASHAIPEELERQGGKKLELAKIASKLQCN